MAHGCSSMNAVQPLQGKLGLSEKNGSVGRSLEQLVRYPLEAHRRPVGRIKPVGRHPEQTKLLSSLSFYPLIPLNFFHLSTHTHTHT